MKKTIVIALAALFTLTASAQNNQRRTRQGGQIDVTEIFTRQADAMASSMKLEGDNKGKFTKLYVEYLQARRALSEPQEAAVNYNKIDDAEATALIEKHFDRQEKQLALDKEYLSKFQDFLTPAQTVRVFTQRNNRMPNFGGNRPMGRGGQAGGRGSNGGDRGRQGGDSTDF